MRYYCLDIFKRAGLELPPYLMACLLQAAFTLGYVVSTPLMSRVSRKPQYLVSAGLIGLSMACIGFCLQMKVRVCLAVAFCKGRSRISFPKRLHFVLIGHCQPGPEELHPIRPSRCHYHGRILLLTRGGSGQLCPPGRDIPSKGQGSLHLSRFFCQVCMTCMYGIGHGFSIIRALTNRVQLTLFIPGIQFE